MSSNDERRRRNGSAGHFFADVITIILFAIAPGIIPLGAVAGGVSFALAAAHSLLTAFVVFPPKTLRRASGTIHSLTELLVAIGLVLGALGVPSALAPRVFFGAAGVAILIAWALTDYRAFATHAAEES